MGDFRVFRTAVTAANEPVEAEIGTGGAIGTDDVALVIILYSSLTVPEAAGDSDTQFYYFGAQFPALIWIKGRVKSSRF